MPGTKVSCPSGREWEQYTLGQAPAESVERLEEHLLVCQACVAVVRGQQDTSAFGRTLRPIAGACEIPQGGEVETLAERMRAVARQAMQDHDTAVPPEKQAPADDAAQHLARRSGRMRLAG